MLQWIYTKYKLALLLSVVTIINESVTKIESFIFEEIVYINEETNVGSHIMVNYMFSCPPIRSYIIKQNEHKKHNHALFFWNINEYQTLIRIQSLSPVLLFLYSGTYSDQYGGKNVVLAGLVLSGLVMAFSYFTMFVKDYIFLVMIVLRQMGGSIVTAGIMSLAGKWAKADEKTMFVSLILMGKSLGIFVGDLISRAEIYWKIICYIYSCLSFFTAFWWWVLFRWQYVPKSYKIKSIPFKKMAMAIDLYIFIFLGISFTVISLVIDSFLHVYLHDVYYFDLNDEWKLVLVLYLTKTLAFLLCGAAGDYIISGGLLSAYYLRRITYSVLLVIFFCTLIVNKEARSCDLSMVLGVSVVLQYLTAIYICIVYSVVLDVTSLYSGTLTGVLITISLPIYYILFELTIITDATTTTPLMEVQNRMFIAYLAISIVFALPYIVCGLKKTSFGNVALTNFPSNSEIMSAVSSRAALKLESVPGSSKASRFSPQNKLNDLNST